MCALIQFECVSMACQIEATRARMAHFPEIPVTVITNFYLKFLSKSTILFQILQTKMITLQIPYVGLASNNITYFIQFKNMKFAHSWKLCHMCMFTDT